jgi:hypothetical protein
MWMILKDRRRREMITWLASGAASVIAGGWALFVFLFPHEPAPPAPSPSIHNECGAAATGNVSVSGTSYSCTFNGGQG